MRYIGWLALIFVLMFTLGLFGCDGSEHDDDDNDVTPSDDDTIDDNTADDDTTDDDTVDDDTVDDDTVDDDTVDDDTGDDDTAPALPPEFIRPDLPINVYHLGATHNSFIWRGLQGVVTLVSSMGVIDSLQKGQVFLELDVNGVTDDGDFLISHGGSTGTFRLSSAFRNLRWWSDTRPDHEVVVIGFQWGVGASPEVMAALRELLAEFFEDPSPMTETGPLYSLADWLDELTVNLDQTTRDALLALSPRDLVRVAGYPTIEQLRGKIVLETNAEMFALQPAFFLMGETGQIDNNSEATLDDLTEISAHRVAQRLTRVYPRGDRIFSGNFNVFKGLLHGVSNNALNMQWTSLNSRSVFAFLDENAPGFAPAGHVLTDGEIPNRLGPPVFCTALAAPETTTVDLDLSFDAELSLPDAPLVLFHLLVQGLSWGATGAVTIDDPEAVVLAERENIARVVTVALPAGTEDVSLSLELAGDEAGYEMHVIGPTVSGMMLGGVLPKGDGTIWISPTFTPVGLTPTDRCTTLGSAGKRLYGQWDGIDCDASNNPSFLIEMEF